ncbi:hypothetical protein [Pseudolysinimonas kribbensis]|nr:hypothetical protein [Pseudolysinimonas kribbensis]
MPGTTWPTTIVVVYRTPRAVKAAAVASCCELDISTLSCWSACLSVTPGA